MSCMAVSIHVGRPMGLDDISILYLYIHTVYTYIHIFAVGGLSFEFCVFVAGWRHALRTEMPFINYPFMIVFTGITK